MLVISPMPYAQCAPEDRVNRGKNRFECRTCPYQMILQGRYYDRKDFELKAAEEVLGGAESWKYADKTDGKYSSYLHPSSFERYFCTIIS
jgi:DNA-directed RNA polymerase III subunit RPC11